MPITLANGEHCQCCMLVADEMPSRTATEVRRTPLHMTVVVPSQSEEAHLIVFPIRHAHTLLDLTDEELDAIATETRTMAAVLARIYDIGDFLIYENNGTASFQEVPHVHFHVIPRFAGREFPRRRFAWDRPALPPTENLVAMLRQARP